MAYRLSATGVSHRIGPIVALDNVSVEAPAGSVLAIVGESGAGKSTLLRCFNALVTPDAGELRVGDDDVRLADPVALRRRIGYVPQHGGLLPHWTILRNVALVPRLLERADAEDAARAMMVRCGLPPATFADRLPHTLSGGQRQRASLARALAAGQAVVLLDEPFGALDAMARDELYEAFAALRRDLGFTAAFITHDLVEAVRLADAVAVMRAGRIEQWAPVAELLRAPATPYVAALLARARSATAALSAVAALPSADGTVT